MMGGYVTLWHFVVIHPREKRIGLPPRVVLRVHSILSSIYGPTLGMSLVYQSRDIPKDIPIVFQN